MDDLDLHLALEALRTNPAAHAYHERVTRGMDAIAQGTLTPFERDALHRLIARFPISPPADPVAALIAAFQRELPQHDSAAVATAIQHALAQRPATLNGAPITIRMDGDTHAHQANLAIGNQVGGNLVQVTVTIPIPDARFDALLTSALRTHEHEKTLDRVRHAAQQIESDRLLHLRLQGFVGRVNELAAIRGQIAMMRPTGGYVLIKAAAGEGKSSSIAKLIQTAGITQTPHHFIALTTGREYQLGLLRAVVAQLILKYELTVSYFPEESYPAMKGEFARILDDLFKQGIQETIYLDGLDQLQPEIDGSRDLSFLPPQPPPGIVIVLGSRPDETLKPLEILHRIDYDLPPLSQADALALWRSVQPAVADSLLHHLYTALKGNALFVHLAADTMREQSMADATSLIRQIEQNPSNLFGITLDRIKRLPHSKWDTVWKPILALLLVAQEPLRLDVVGDLLGHDHDTMHDAIAVLGGLVSQGIDQRVALHHLLFRDYLAVSVFNIREVKRWHQRLADWCAINLDSIWADHHDAMEQARRIYARHHYITHLALAENWLPLWQVLDAGDYGEYKTRFDPSARLYALDLDRGRESAINAGQSTEEHVQNLPRLWKYSLLRTSLTSRADLWPDEAFEALAILGRTHEAMERIELLSRTDKQLSCWIKILPWCDTQQLNTIAVRLHTVGMNFSAISNLFATSTMIQAVATSDQHEHAVAIIDTTLTTIHTISYPHQRATALSTIAQATATLGDIDRAMTIAHTIADPHQLGTTLLTIAEAALTLGDIDHAMTIAHTIADPHQLGTTLSAIAKATAALGDIDRAMKITNTIADRPQRATTLSAIAKATATLGDIDRAMNITNTIADPPQRATTLSTIAEVAATYGDINRAMKIAYAIIDPHQRLSTIGVIATALAIHGDIDHALTIAKTIADPRQRAITIGSVAEAIATLGDIDHALSLAKTITNPHQRTTTISVIVKTLATYGDINRALSIAHTIVDQCQQAITLSTIAEVAATCGQHEHALVILNMAFTIAHAIDSLWQCTTAFSAIAKTLATYGDIDRALNIANTIVDPRQQAMTLSTITEAAVTLGDIDQAMTIAHTIDYASQRDTTLSTIAEAAATLGNIDQAMTITYAIADPRQQATTLAIIAEAAATHGDIDRAMNIAHTIDYASQRADTLKRIVQRVRSITKKSVIVQNTWFRSTIADDLWAVTSLITPLIKDYVWLGTAILQEEEWVNAQLKRLG